MKLLLPAILLLPFLSPATGEPSPRLRPSLSATTKKPASLAGFLYLILTIAPLNGSFPSATLFPLASLSPQLLIQTPSSL